MIDLSTFATYEQTITTGCKLIHYESAVLLMPMKILF